MHSPASSTNSTVKEFVPSEVLTHSLRRQISDKFGKMAGKEEATWIKKPAFCIVGIDLFRIDGFFRFGLSRKAVRRESDAYSKPFSRRLLCGGTLENMFEGMNMSQIE
jgi:hypothetical protein